MVSILESYILIIALPLFSNCALNSLFSHEHKGLMTDICTKLGLMKSSTSIHSKSVWLKTHHCAAPENDS